MGLGLVRVRRPPPYPAQTLLGPKQRGGGEEPHEGVGRSLMRVCRSRRVDFYSSHSNRGPEVISLERRATD